MENHFKVSWTIDIWALNPESAANKALEIMRDSNSIALVFNIKCVKKGQRAVIDLLKNNAD